MEAATHANLSSLLDPLKPSRKRRIYIALPRHVFFARRIEFPKLPLDDISDAMINNLETYSHLPLEDIYYDILFSEAGGNGVNALLYYAPRKKIDAYINQIRESGHMGSLETIFPLSYGAGPYYWERTSQSNNALMIQYRDTTELAIYHGNTCIDTFTAGAADGIEARDGMVRDILADYGMAPDQVRHANDQAPDSQGSRDENMGDLSIAPVFSGIQMVGVDWNAPRIKLFKPYTVLIPLFVILAAVIVYLSIEIRENIAARQAEVDELKTAIKVIDGEIDPILEAQAALEKATSYKGDVEAFMATRPPVFTYLNDIAGNVPPDTWFPALSYKPGVISMQARGNDILKVVESLRASGKYKDVKIMGSVSKTKDGKDKFMLDLILKEPVDILKGRAAR